MQIAKIPAAGGAAVGVLDFDNGVAASSFAVDSTSVHFVDTSTQDIWRTPK